MPVFSVPGCLQPELLGRAPHIPNQRSTSARHAPTPGVLYKYLRPFPCFLLKLHPGRILLCLDAASSYPQVDSTPIQCARSHINSPVICCVSEGPCSPRSKFRHDMGPRLGLSHNYNLLLPSSRIPTVNSVHHNQQHHNQHHPHRCCHPHARTGTGKAHARAHAPRTHRPGTRQPTLSSKHSLSSDAAMSAMCV